LRLKMWLTNLNRCWDRRRIPKGEMKAQMMKQMILIMGVAPAVGGNPVVPENLAEIIEVVVGGEETKEGRLVVVPPDHGKGRETKDETAVNLCVGTPGVADSWVSQSLRFKRFLRKDRKF
jgi:hypothetical protein